MTDLRKRIKRRTVNSYNYQGRRLVVILEPGDVIAFREERCRKVFRAPLSRVFTQVVAWNLEAERAEKRKVSNRSRPPKTSRK